MPPQTGGAAMGSGPLAALFALVPELEPVLLLIPAAMLTLGLLLQLLCRRAGAAAVRCAPCLAGLAVLFLSEIGWHTAAMPAGEGLRSFCVLLCFFAFPGLLGAGCGALLRNIKKSRRIPAGKE